MDSQSSPPNNNDDPGRKEARDQPDPQDPLERAARRVEDEHRDFAKQFRKYGARGIAFQAGKEIFKQILDLLSEN